MIIDIFILLISAFLGIIEYLLGLISYIIPSQIATAFSTFFGYVQIGNGLFPVDQALLAISAVLTVWILIYIVKIILFAFSAIPWIGKVLHLPQHNDTTTTQTGTATDTIGGETRTRNWNTTTQRKRSDK